MEETIALDAAPTAEVHVVGGGIGGLTCAALVARAGRTVVVHEQRRTPGGRAATDVVDGFRFNRGPHALYLAGEARRILRTLGIHPTGHRPPTSARLVDGPRGGRAPGGLVDLLRTDMLGWRDKLELGRLLSRVPRLQPARFCDTTTAGWVDDVAARERVRRMLHSFIRLSTYVNAPEQLSAEVAIGQLQLALGGGVVYLDRGWAQLVDALRRVPGVRVVHDTVTELPDAPCTVVAVGTPAAASRLTGTAVAEVGPPADVAVLDVGLRRAPVHDVVLGLDTPMYLSNHGVAADMTPPDRWSVSVAEYLAPGEEPSRARLQGFLGHAGIAADHVVAERYLHRMPAVAGIATAARGGLRGRPSPAAPGTDGVFVVGDWVGARGHLVDAVVASAEAAATAALRHLDRRAVIR